jgi:hypothetical protein
VCSNSARCAEWDPGCARFYWLACMVFGYHNSYWPSAKIIAHIKWFTKHYGIDDEGFRAWFKMARGGSPDGPA